jgi:acid phosphatase type 7
VDAKGNPYAGYRRYFGARAHWNTPRGGSYSYNLGAWHIVSLNSQWCWSYTSVFEGGRWNTVPAWGSGSPWGCHKGDPMYDWFARDLKQHQNDCTLVYFHHPSYFGVGSGWPGGTGSLVHGVYSHTRPLYRVFYRNGGDVVLNGHEHFYQRTVPIDPLGKADPAHGFTEFIVGTGGDTLEPMPPVSHLPKEIAAASNTAFGILSMTLQPHAYRYRFVPVAGSPGRWVYSPRRGYKIFKNRPGTGRVDSGTGTCHGAP